MGKLIIQVGQCGNQVGNEFWKLLSNEMQYYPSGIPSFFDVKNKARCILVDSEPKVIHSISKSKYFLKENCITQQSGCGNIFAMGYSNTSLLNAALERVRIEFEKMEYVDSIIVIHSVGGGTGSGLGCHLIEELRQEFPELYILSIAIFPFLQGETPLQHYNTLLSITHLQMYADAVLLFQNDHLMKERSFDFDRFSTKDLNLSIATCLASIMLPMQISKYEQRDFSVPNLVTAVCPSPECKFIQCQTSSIIKRPLTTWQYILDNFHKRVPKYDLNNKIIKSISSQLFLRGGITESEFEFLYKTIRKLYVPVEWNDEPFHLITSNNPAFRSLKTELSLSVCSNRSDVIPLFGNILSKSHLMVSNNAYLTWYERYGIDSEYFKSSIDVIQDVIYDYAYYCK